MTYHYYLLLLTGIPFCACLIWLFVHLHRRLAAARIEKDGVIHDREAWKRRAARVLVVSSANLASFDVMHSDRKPTWKDFNGVNKESYEAADFMIYLNIATQKFEVLKERLPLRMLNKEPCPFLGRP